MATWIMGSSRTHFILGARDMVPLFLGAVPFGLVLGVAIAETSVPNWAGFLSSSLIFGGAAQLGAITLLGSGAPALSALAAALVINSRHVMYSAAMVPRFRAQPIWFRRIGPYFLLDQVFALASLNRAEPYNWRAYYLGAGVFAWTAWQLIVGLGIVVGAVIPQGLGLDFAIPVMFIGLFVPSLTRKPPVVAAITGVVVTALTASVPNRGGMLIGGAVGMIAGTLVERRASS